MNKINAQSKEKDQDSKNKIKAHNNNENPVKSTLFGVGITNEILKNILEYIVKKIEKSKENIFVVTPNPEMIVLAQKKPEFKSILNEADLALCDGIGLWWASKLLGKPIKERVTGVDLMEKLCQEVSNRPITVGFLGGRDGVAELTAECLRSQYPSLKVVFAGEEWEEKSKVKSQKSKLQIKSQNYLENDQRPIDILFVAFGFPKQELWMHEHINTIPARVLIGVGGAFDYVSGKIPRAPIFIRTIGLEWLYRLIRQPWRWRRQVALLEFLLLTMRETIKIGS